MIVGIDLRLWGAFEGVAGGGGNVCARFADNGLYACNGDVRIQFGAQGVVTTIRAM